MTDTATRVSGNGRGDNARSDVPILDIRKAVKAYRGIYAIRDVDFSVYPGEVHALVGENGAGKSTLCKVISGAIRLNSGEMQINGEPVEFNHPNDALKHGMAMVYQETSLVPTMTVAQNLDLGHEPWLTRTRTINISGQQLLASMNFGVDPAAYVYTLGGAQKQMVEIARALRINAQLIIFDEPTASLAPEDTMHLFETIETLTKRGIGVIFVSHALEEALQISDRITVLRDGRHVITEDAKKLTRDDLVRHMVGRDITAAEYVAGTTDGGTTGRVRRQEVLAVQNVTMGAVVKNMSFSAYAGEVLRLRPRRFGPDRDGQDRVRGAQAQPDQRRLHPPAGQTRPLPGTEAGHQGRHLLHHRRPQGQRVLRDDGHRREHLHRRPGGWEGEQEPGGVPAEDAGGRQGVHRTAQHPGHQPRRQDRRALGR